MQLIPHAMGTLIFVVVLYLVNQTIFSSFSSSAALIISFASMIHVKKFMKQEEAVMDFELGSFCSLGH